MLIIRSYYAVLATFCIRSCSSLARYANEPNRRFWIRKIDVSKEIENSSLVGKDSSSLSNFVDNLSKLLSDNEKTPLPHSSVGVVIIPKHRLLVPMIGKALQTQHAIVCNELWDNESDTNNSVRELKETNIIICGFLPSAQGKDFCQTEEQRAVDEDRLEALNKILFSITGITPEELMNHDYQSTPPARIYRSFVSPRAKGKVLLTSLETAAERTAMQIDFALRQLRTQLRNDLVRNHDKSANLLMQRRDSNDSDVAEASSESSRADSSPAPPKFHKKTFPIVLVLDNIRSALNVGSMFRTAETAGLEKVVTCGITAHPPHPKLAKTALSATEIVNTGHFDDVMEAIDSLKADGYTIVVMETTSASRLYTEVAFPKKIAVVVGNEITGVDVRIIAKADLVVEIPTFGVKNSLNVAAAAPIVLYEVIRQYTTNSPPGL